MGPDWAHCDDKEGESRQLGCAGEWLWIRLPVWSQGDVSSKKLMGLTALCLSAKGLGLLAKRRILNFNTN